LLFIRRSMTEQVQIRSDATSLVWDREFQDGIEGFFSTIDSCEVFLGLSSDRLDNVWFARYFVKESLYCLRPWILGKHCVIEPRGARASIVDLLLTPPNSSPLFSTNQWIWIYHLHASRSRILCSFRTNFSSTKTFRQGRKEIKNQSSSLSGCHPGFHSLVQSLCGYGVLIMRQKGLKYFIHSAKAHWYCLLAFFLHALMMNQKSEQTSCQRTFAFSAYWVLFLYWITITERMLMKIISLLLNYSHHHVSSSPQRSIR